MQKMEIADREIYLSKWQQEIDNNAAMQQYFKSFSDTSVKHFVEYYISNKFYWHYNADYTEKNNESERLKWIDSSFKHLEIILQKKLFDAQCLWRAEKLVIPGVSVCYDFMLWENDIFNCPFIEPVNTADIELYMQYLQQNNVDMHLYWHSGITWQDYEEIKDAYNTGNESSNFPEWYDFHNGRTGAGTHMLLPDIRGVKEEFYRRIYFNKQWELNKAEHDAWEERRDKRPWLDPSDADVVKYFVTSFENKTVKNYYEEYSFANRDAGKKEQVEELVRQLLNIDEFVPIESHYDWVEALEKALVRYKCKKIAEILPIALEQYQINIQMGIAFACDRKYKHDGMWKDVTKPIIEGRKLNGEAPDFNF